MSLKASTTPLKGPAILKVPPLSSNSGASIPAIERLRIFSPSQWEDFTLEWAHSLKNQYVRVERCGGSGDLGRDVIAYLTDDLNGIWHNYQCKHYKDPLQPNRIMIELGKLCYYTYKGLYRRPEAYFFVAPQGVGNALSQLLQNPTKLRDRLIKDWDSKCADKITEHSTIPLEDDLLEYVHTFNFSIVDYIPPMDLLEQHATTRWHVARFGTELPERPKTIVPPIEEEDYESTYIFRLIEAYCDHLGCSVGIDSLTDYSVLLKHLLRSRERFFHAEALRNFSRDNLPPGQFEELQDEFFDGVIDNVEDLSHKDGYNRVKTTTSIAQKLDPTNNTLREVLGIRDKAGICHQLADDGRIQWVLE